MVKAEHTPFFGVDTSCQHRIDHFKLPHCGFSYVCMVWDSWACSLAPAVLFCTMCHLLEQTGFVSS